MGVQGEPTFLNKINDVLNKRSSRNVRVYMRLFIEQEPSNGFIYGISVRPKIYIREGSIFFYFQKKKK